MMIKIKDESKSTKLLEPFSFDSNGNVKPGYYKIRSNRGIMEEAYLYVTGIFHTEGNVSFSRENHKQEFGI